MLLDCALGEIQIRANLLVAHALGDQRNELPFPEGKSKCLALSWDWKVRSSIKIMERMHAKRTQALKWRTEGSILRRHSLDRMPVSDLCDGALPELMAEHGVKEKVLGLVLPQ